MNITLSNALLFGGGVVVGVAATAKFFKTKYERIAQEEVESVKRAFSAPLSEFGFADTDDRKDDCAPSPEEIEAVNAVIETCNYGGASVPKHTVRKEETGVEKEPYVISPSEFDTEDGYSACSLTYYADGVVTDERDIPIEDVEGVIGRESLTHYGEYEDDAIHVRNPALKCDFEVLRDLRNYSDIYKTGARPDAD